MRALLLVLLLPTVAAAWEPTPEVVADHATPAGSVHAEARRTGYVHVVARAPLHEVNVARSATYVGAGGYATVVAFGASVVCVSGEPSRCDPVIVSAAGSVMTTQVVAWAYKFERGPPTACATTPFGAGCQALP